MPTSSPDGKMWMKSMFMNLVQRSDVKRVIDIGPGMGTYSGMKQAGQHWTGVEVWAPYVDRYKLDQKYDRIIVADARYLDWAKTGGADVVIAGDVLEHMSKEDATTLVAEALEHARVMLVSLPVVHYPQHEGDDGNPYQRHVKDDWSHEEVIATLPSIASSWTEGEIGVYAMALNPADIDMVRYLGHRLNDRLRERQAQQL